MAQANYMSRLRNSGASALSSIVCRCCYHNGARVPFFGVQRNGGVTVGNRPKDRNFHKAMWLAAKKHMQEEHGLEFVSNGHPDGYKLRKIQTQIKKR